MLSGALDDAKPVKGPPLGEAINEPLKKSVEELDTLLKEHGDWRKKSGLVFATAKDGTSEWVLPEHVERFESEGKALLGREGGASEEEKAAHATAREQLTQRKAQQKQLSAETTPDKATAGLDGADMMPDSVTMAMMMAKMDAMSADLAELKAQKQGCCTIS